MKNYFKITARTAHDSMEIWPFKTESQAKKECIKSNYDTKLIQEVKY